MSLTAYQAWQRSGTPLTYAEWPGRHEFKWPNNLDKAAVIVEDRGGCSSEGCELSPMGVHLAAVASLGHCMGVSSAPYRGELESDRGE